MKTMEMADEFVSLVSRFNDLRFEILNGEYSWERFILIQRSRVLAGAIENHQFVVDYELVPIVKLFCSRAKPGLCKNHTETFQRCSLSGFHRECRPSYNDIDDFFSNTKWSYRDPRGSPWYRNRKSFDLALAISNERPKKMERHRYFICRYLDALFFLDKETTDILWNNMKNIIISEVVHES